MNAQDEIESIQLHDVHLSNRLHLKLKILPKYEDVLPDQMLDNLFSNHDDQFKDEKVKKIVNLGGKACFLYYYGQFEKIGVIFIGYMDGSIEMVSMLKTQEEREDVQSQQPKRFSFVDKSRKRQRCHQAQITGILCFSVVSGMSLLMTSCADGFVKFWFLDTDKVDDEIQPCLKLFDIGHEYNLESSVVSLKFVYNEVYYSSCATKEDFSLWRVFHVVAVCRNGNIYRWDPALIPKVIMTEVSRYEVQNIFTLLTEEYVESPELISEIKGGNVEVVCATLSQKITTTAQAYIVCGLSNGMIVSVSLSFKDPDEESKTIEEDYRLTNISFISDTFLQSNPPTKIVEIYPFSPNNGFHILSRNKVFNFNPKSKGIFLYFREDNSDLITICEYLYFTNGRELGENVTIPVDYVSQQFTVRDLCWIARGSLMCVSSEEGNLLLYHKEQENWYELVCLEHTLLKYTSFSIINHCALSDVFIIAQN
ncbi:predicted protein [Naegleria gruberi]|uniref:Predicted protein n=1 Tax=Naegleria gruberi TaxID=5762 RepID=D2VL23_NAEGR|nr:uncharacterized protein NAEGRDRAFT_69635 [Naegleria gruberi]EFC42462.1 predicted protein [Naegleria gruberi]|eukprot:XP_002675206.1 predicted protein [Naegleria gruberi strain NEG-M]